MSLGEFSAERGTRSGFNEVVLKKLLQQIKTECPKGLWAQGEKLARKHSVAGVSSSDEEIVLRVKSPALPVAPTVVLYPSDGEWDCDCPSQMDTCAHIAAAIIAMVKVREIGEDLPVSRHMGGTIHYRFSIEDRGLSLQRVIVEGKDETVIEGTTVYTLVTSPGKGPDINANNTDLEIDSILGVRPPRILPTPMLQEIFGTLSSVDRVSIDGKAIETSGVELLPSALIRNQGTGVRLSIMANNEMDELVVDGVAVSKGVLRVLGETQVTGTRLENLPITMVYTAERLGELVTSVLPTIEQQVILDIRTDRLPGIATGLTPRIDLAIEQEGAKLSVLPTLVYGDPPQARIELGKMIHLSKLAPARDHYAERALIEQLRDQLNLVPGRQVNYEGTEAAAFSEKMRRWRGEVQPGQDDLLYRHPLIPRLIIDGETHQLFFETSEKDSGNKPRRVEASAVIGAWRGGLQLVPVEGGGWAPLPAAWLGEHGHRVADLLAAREMSREDDELPLFAVPALSQLAEAMGQPKPISFERLAPLLADFEKLETAPLPDDLDAELREYQIRGVNWLAFLRNARLGAVLADDMGLGKTLQTICILHGRCLVVCPTSVVHNWASEIERFRPGLTTAIYHGAKRQLDPNVDVLLTTYAILRIDAAKIAKEKWDVVVLDEAQAIKNPSSQVAKAAYKINAYFRVALSGTPVENRLEELWSLMHYCNPGLLGTRADFANRYSKPISRGEDGAAARLRKKLRPFVLRRIKRDVAPELPPRTDSILHVELDETERGVYDAVRAATRKDIVERLTAGGSVLAALEALLRLRQAACHTALIPGQEADSSAKVRTLVNALTTAAANGHKALVFSQWTSMLNLIEPHLKRMNIDFIRLDGATTNRKGVVTTFQSPDGPPVLLASLKAGGTGLNLTAADHVFLVDPWWNPAAEDQAADRAHRIGQDRPVMVYRLVTRDTVEERILALQHSKRSLADAALGEADRATSLTREDLLALLE
ncbi:MAG: DEAD/DEAH box helicase [Kofleriaceae bacterium]|nr:DEAD/DEAH box helicase [Kofleriaceae bacterium]